MGAFDYGKYNLQINAKAKILGPYRFKIGDNKGNVYLGQWLNGKMHGRGKLVEPKGHIYEGEWENGLKNGKGMLIRSDGDVY